MDCLRTLGVITQSPLGSHRLSFMIAIVGTSHGPHSSFSFHYASNYPTNTVNANVASFLSCILSCLHSWADKGERRKQHFPDSWVLLPEATACLWKRFQICLTWPKVCLLSHWSCPYILSNIFWDRDMHSLRQGHALGRMHCMHSSQYPSLSHLGLSSLWHAACLYIRQAANPFFPFRDSRKDLEKVQVTSDPSPLYVLKKMNPFGWGVWPFLLIWLLLSMSRVS